MEIEIWSDVACPWCYVGKRRFEAALAQFEHREEVEVVWRSFELDPQAPAQRSGDRVAHLAQKYGMSLARARESQQQMTDTAAGEGLTFRLEIARAGNTFDAHRVVQLAREHGIQDAVKERLLRAYFSEGELISDRERLVALGAEVGLAAAELRATLAGDRFAAEVRDDERSAAALGISAVPTFVVDRAIGVSGAQPPEALLALLRQGWANQPGVAPASAAPGAGLPGAAGR